MRQRGFRLLSPLKSAQFEYDGNDCIYGGPGNDLIDGGAGNDRLFGNEGTDTLIGDAGTNFVWAGPDRGQSYPASPPHKLRHLIESLVEHKPYLEAW